MLSCKLINFYHFRRSYYTMYTLHTHTHTYISIYTNIHVCVCICICRCVNLWLLYFVYVGFGHIYKWIMLLIQVEKCDNWDEGYLFYWGSSGFGCWLCGGNLLYLPPSLGYTMRKLSCDWNENRIYWLNQSVHIYTLVNRD